MLATHESQVTPVQSLQHVTGGDALVTMHTKKISFAHGNKIGGAQVYI